MLLRWPRVSARRVGRAALIALSLATSTGCRPRGAPDYFITSTHAFVLTTTPTHAPDAGPPPSATVVTSHEVRLRLDPFASNFGFATLTGRGVKVGGTYTIRGATLELAFDSPAQIPAVERAGCVASRVSYETFSFSVSEFADDGSIARLEGTTLGTVSYVLGDVADSIAFSGPVVGVRDASPPALTIAIASPIHPTAPLRITLEEPIDAASLDLVDAITGAAVEPGGFAPIDGSIPAVSYVRTADTALPYGGAFRVQAPAGEGLDADGMSAMITTFEVADAPPAITSSDFEGSEVESFGSAARVDASDAPTWPAIEGTHALAFAPGATATLRLASTTETELVLRVRYGAPEGFAIASSVRLGFFDTTTRASVHLAPPDDLVWSADGGADLEATQVVTFTVPLPAFVRGTTFSVGIAGPEANVCGSLPAPPSHLLVEEIRLQ